MQPLFPSPRANFLGAPDAILKFQNRALQGWFWNARLCFSNAPDDENALWWATLDEISEVENWKNALENEKFGRFFRLSRGFEGVNPSSQVEFNVTQRDFWVIADAKNGGLALEIGKIGWNAFAPPGKTRKIARPGAHIPSLWDARRSVNFARAGLGNLGLILAESHVPAHEIEVWRQGIGCRALQLVNAVLVLRGAEILRQERTRPTWSQFWWRMTGQLRPESDEKWAPRGRFHFQPFYQRVPAAIFYSWHSENLALRTKIPLVPNPSAHEQLEAALILKEWLGEIPKFPSL